MGEPAEKAGLRNAWGRVADAYEDAWAERTAHLTATGLDLLAAPAGGRGLDVACGPGLTTVALAERLDGGEALGVDFAPAMVERATARHGARPGVAFAVDDAERLGQPDAAFDVVTCSFGLMYCYDATAAVRHMARVVRPGGRVLNVVWGRAARVWFVPVIELIESRAEYYSAVCPMMFFYGLPGVLPRMLGEAGLEPVEARALDARMRFPGVADAVETAIAAGPLWGLFANRLDARAQAEVREALAAHVESLAEPDGAGIALPAEAVVVVAGRPGG
ncbi:class I SAM-dependent methyltransferase [Miltoncostaea marina]|uniref:class I SAM-dependent methyltransferase n=1 Tax=Miltoncostaea marina TaxID=2843215 RepID=UPI001C3C3A1B|nr:class I SAM-dependent methyltransferase [Miltoncostaea marina]